MMWGRVLGVLGGLLALVAGIVSIATRTPLITHLTGIEMLSGGVLVFLGSIGVVGGLLAVYGGAQSRPLHAIIGGILGLLAPCGLALLAIIGGVLLYRSQGK